jgi:hypothetical protein
MSLPNVVVFYKNGNEIKRAFINCGWICNPNTVKSAIKRTLIDCCEVFEWDVAEAYGMKISKIEVIPE